MRGLHRSHGLARWNEDEARVRQEATLPPRYGAVQVNQPHGEVFYDLRDTPSQRFDPVHRKPL